MRKPRKKATLVSTPTQTYHGKATSTKAKAAQRKRLSHRKRKFRPHSKNRPLTANGNTRPTGPLLSTAQPAFIPPMTDQTVLLALPSAASGGWTKLCQYASSVSRVKAFSKASGLAK